MGVCPTDRVMETSAVKAARKKASEKERKARVTELMGELASALPREFCRHKTQQEVLEGALEFVRRSRSGETGLGQSAEATLRAENAELATQVAWLKAQLARVSAEMARPVNLHRAPASPRQASSALTKPGMADATTETDEMMQVITIPPNGGARQAVPIPNSTTIHNYNYVIINNDNGRNLRNKKHGVTRPTNQCNTPGFVPIAPRAALEAVQTLSAISDTGDLEDPDEPLLPPSQVITTPHTKNLVSVRTQTLESSIPPKPVTPSPPPVQPDQRGSSAAEAASPDVARPPSPDVLSMMAAPLSPQFGLAANPVSPPPVPPQHPASAAASAPTSISRVTQVQIGTPPPAETSTTKFSAAYLSNDTSSSGKSKGGGRGKGSSSKTGGSKGGRGRGGEKSLVSGYSEPTYDYAQHQSQQQQQQQHQPVYGVYTGAIADENSQQASNGAAQDLNLLFEAGSDEVWTGNQYASNSASDYVPNLVANWPAPPTSSAALSSATSQPCSQQTAASFFPPQSSAASAQLLPPTAQGLSASSVGLDQHQYASLYGRTAAYDHSVASSHSHTDKGFSFHLSPAAATTQPSLRPVTQQHSKHQGNFHIANMLTDASGVAASVIATNAHKRKRPAVSATQPAHPPPPKLLYSASAAPQPPAPTSTAAPYSAAAHSLTPQQQAQLYLGTQLNPSLFPGFNFNAHHH